jgi:TorA maturation chaperone TorD
VELIRALGLLTEPPSTEHVRVAHLLGLGTLPEASEYTDLFLLQLYPYASIYLSADGMMGGDPADRIGGFWSALGQVPPAEPDHLSALLSLFASLREAHEAERDEATRLLLANARDTLLTDHLLSWLPSYLRAVDALGGEFHRAWAALLCEALREVSGPAMPQTGNNPYLEGICCLEDPRDVGGEAFLEGLLAPAKSGFILARADLAGAARSLGLGSRIGERSYQIKALLSQDAEAVLTWLHTAVMGWVDWHANRSWGPEYARGHWLSRSTHTRDLLESLLAEGWVSED